MAELLEIDLEEDDVQLQEQLFQLLAPSRKAELEGPGEEPEPALLETLAEEPPRYAGAKVAEAAPGAPQAEASTLEVGVTLERLPTEEGGEDSDTEPTASEDNDFSDPMEDLEEQAEEDALDEDAMAKPVEVPPRQAPKPPPLPEEVQVLKGLLQVSRGACEAFHLTYPDFLRRLRGHAAEMGKPEAARSKVSFTMKPSARGAPAPAPAAARRLPRLWRALNQPMPGEVLVVDEEVNGTHKDPADADAEPEAPDAPEEEVPEAFTSATAMVVLLRTYLQEERWVGALDGWLLFEADAVKYPLDSGAPLKSPDQPELLSLGSLFAVAALGERYEGCATPELLESLCARKLQPDVLEELAEYLQGRSESCSLLLSAGKAKQVPPVKVSHLAVPFLKATQRRKKRRKKRRRLDLERLPGQADEEEESPGSPSERTRSGKSRRSQSADSEETTVPRDRSRPKEPASQAEAPEQPLKRKCLPPDSRLPDLAALEASAERLRRKGLFLRQLLDECEAAKEQNLRQLQRVEVLLRSGEDSLRETLCSTGVSGVEEFLQRLGQDARRLYHRKDAAVGAAG